VNDMKSKPGRKRDESVEHDHLRKIIQRILDPKGMNPLKLVREAGFDKDSLEGKAAYQAIKRWAEDRASESQEPKGQEKEPCERYPSRLALKYRRHFFVHIRTHYWDEYIQPLPPGERWITAEESERWNYDTRSTRWLRRDPDALEDFARYIKGGGTIRLVTRQFISAEIDYADGVSTEKTYGPPGGLTEEDYLRLNDDELLFETSQALAWAVIDNLLWKMGLIRSQIQRTRRVFAKRSLTGVSDVSLMDLIEANTFEVVANVLFNEVTKAPKRKR
jgi:hypothetical protein